MCITLLLIQYKNYVVYLVPGNPTNKRAPVQLGVVHSTGHTG